jgi:hypothetical protein
MKVKAMYPTPINEELLEIIPFMAFLLFISLILCIIQDIKQIIK